MLFKTSLEPEDYKSEDRINPDHYKAKDFSYQAIDVMKAFSTPEEFRGHLRLNCLKYLLRYGKKDECLQELEKAQWYLNRLVEELKND